MTVRTLAKRMSERRLSFRRGSDPGDSSTDLSASCHRRSGALRRRPSLGGSSLRRPFSRRGSQRSSLRSSSFRSSFNSDVSDEEIIIDPATQAMAIRAAEDEKGYFRESLPPSLQEAYDTRDCVAPFQSSELVLGPKLGSGEFSDVYEVQSIALKPVLQGSDRLMGDDEANKRVKLKKYEKYRDTGKARYAVKHLKDGYFGSHDRQSYVQAASDLALEAEFLACLQHPNIIKLRGISLSGAAGFADGPSGYFLVIDRLQDTLEQRITHWRAPSAKGRRMARLNRSITALPAIPWSSKTHQRRASDEGQENETLDMDDEAGRKEMLDERLNVALQIAAALVYLHQHSVIFRDLKPANIGFDVRGDVKIFDFGLARVMPDNGNPNTDLFDMSGAGSPRYMAPECLSREPYNLKADVYSFSIILWEILTGQTPYMWVRRRYELIQHVTKENGRPLIDKTWPETIQGMLESSFDADIGKRPKMSLWYDIIRDTLISLRGGDARGLNDTWIRRRRSFGSMKDLFSEFSRHSRPSLLEELSEAADNVSEQSIVLDKSESNGPVTSEQKEVVVAT